MQHELLIFLSLASALSAADYHVAKRASDLASGAVARSLR